MSSKTLFQVAPILTAALLSTLPINSWSQSFIEQWKGQTLERIERADFVSFDAAEPAWYNSNAKPKIKAAVPELDALELSLSPWARDLELEDECVQSLLEGNMFRLQILHVMQVLYASDIERALSQKNIPSSFQWIPILASSYNHAFKESNGHAGLWGLTRAQADKANVLIDHRVDERMLPQEATRAAIELLDRLHRRFPMNPERVLVGFIKGMPFASRWSGEPGYDEGLDEWLALYRVIARFMVNLEAPDFEGNWGGFLTTWRPVSCPNNNKLLNGELGMTVDIQNQLLPWWTGADLTCSLLEEYQPYFPNEWAVRWDLSFEKSPASLGADTINNVMPNRGNSNSVLPETLDAESKAPCFEHEVKKGDTLYNISRRFPGTTPATIAAKNRITDVIKIGQILCIPRLE